MNYSPVFDAMLTGVLLGACVLAALQYIVEGIHWRRVAAMFRRAGKWGGE